jgi:hypothetical protein
LSFKVEIDEVYQTAGLKGRNNSSLIKLLGGKPRRRGLRGAEVGEHMGRIRFQSSHSLSIVVGCLSQNG